MLVWQAHKTKIRSLVFSPDGTRIATTADKDGTVCLWHAPTGQLLRKFLAPHPFSDHAAVFLPDGRHLAQFSGLFIFLWNLETPNWVAWLRSKNTGRLEDFAVPPDGSRLVAAVRHEGIAEWEEPTRPTSGSFREEDLTHDIQHPGASSIGFSTTGKYFCVAGWYMHLHTPDLKKELRQIRDPRSGDKLGASVNAFEFNTDDSRLVLALGHRAAVWSPDDLEASPVLIAGHGKKVMGVGFLPGGQVLTAGMDGTARVWDQNTGAELRRFAWSIGKVSAAAVSPDGTLCAVGSVDGRILIWDIDS